MKERIERINLLLVNDKNANRSAWGRAVTAYALELLDTFVSNYGFDVDPTEKDLLNGARNWSEYSWGGCSLIYNQDIAERCCNPSELKRTNNGNWRPNRAESWLDVQARALYQASRRVLNAYKRVKDIVVMENAPEQAESKTA